MWQNKERSIFPAICILCLVIMAFIFVVKQNIVKADDVQDIININESISERLENKTTNFILSNIYEAREKYDDTFDTQSDYSFQKYVSDTDVLQNKKYEPSDLALITWEYLVVKTTRPYMRQSAAYALNELSKAYYEKFDHKIYVLSAYRSYNDQVHLFEQWCSTLRCAKIWASEHQLGLAVDIHTATKDWYTQFSSWQMAWLNENAYKYGYINTYSKWPKIDWKMKENRHWRFVGVPFATELHEKNMSFAERVKDNEELAIEDE